MNKYGVMYYEGWAGVIRYESGGGYSWVTSVDYTAREAEKMAAALNRNPNLDTSDLLLILEAA